MAWSTGSTGTTLRAIADFKWGGSAAGEVGISWAWTDRGEWFAWTIGVWNAGCEPDDPYPELKRMGVVSESGDNGDLGDTVGLGMGRNESRNSGGEIGRPRFITPSGESRGSLLE